MTLLKPKLRFNEFSESWIEKPIENSIDFISGFAFKADEISEDPNGVPLMRGINITEGSIRHNKEIDRYFVGDTKKLEKYKLKKGDIVIGMDGSKVGKNSAIVPDIDSDSLLVQRVARLREKENSSLNFIYHHINSKRFHAYVDEVKTSSGIPHISASDIKNFNIFIPTLPEQTKIANFLTAVDEKIQALKEKKRLLEEYKKGLMQKIFSQEIRFKQDDGSDFPDWEEKALGEICGNVMYGMNSAAIEYDGINKYLRITDIDENSRKFIPNPLTSPEGEIEAKYKLKEGDLVFARTGASVGKSYLYKKEDGNLLFAGFLIKFSVINHNPYFVYCQTLQTPFNKWVKLMSMRSGQPGINAEEYKTFLIQLSCIQEQHKIANFLTSIDEKIEKLGQQIEEAQTFKKGLLQQMFV